MRRLVTLLSLLLAALAVPATVAGPAHAKGATSVTVSGPGIDERTLGFTRRTDDVDVGSLAEASNIYGIWGDGQFADAPALTADELGPRYRLTWYEGNVRMVVSHVYPFAEAGAWAEVPVGQRLWREPVATGWWHGGSELARQLTELGATAAATTATDGSGSDQAAGAIGTPATPASSSPSGLPLVATGSAVLAGLALLAGSVWWLRRRRTPAAA
jgi:hypothetical protein